MFDSPNSDVAIVDFGVGNLFSVKHACEQAGMRATITTSRDDILQAFAVVLPGVGAFGDAMDALTRLDLVSLLRDVAESGKPFVGICLGMQLLMTESHEFGHHRGLGIIEGEVVGLKTDIDGPRVLKVPHVAWNRIYGTPITKTWDRSLLEGIPDGEFMYFVHSFHAVPADPAVALSATRYGPMEFCSSLCRGNVFACQFHPERSGSPGLRIYHNLAATISGHLTERSNA